MLQFDENIAFGHENKIWVNELNAVWIKCTESVQEFVFLERTRIETCTNSFQNHKTS